MGSKNKDGQFKYKSKFAITANLKRDDFEDGQFVSKASMKLDGLKSLFPDKAEIEANPDLLYTVFNAAVVNLINDNGDGMLTDTAIAISKTFINKCMNLEHDRSEVVGFITNTAFSTFGTNEIISTETASQSGDPFNICLSAIVWKICNGWFAEHLQESQKEGSWSYKSVSASWEVGFNEYWLATGSKDLRRANLIKDPEQIKKLSKYLRSEGGTGFLPDGTELYRIIRGDARFLGCAFTSNPAAAVEGVLSMCKESMEEEEDEDESNSSEAMKKSKCSEDCNCDCEDCEDCAKCKKAKCGGDEPLDEMEEEDDEEEMAKKDKMGDEKGKEEKSKKKCKADSEISDVSSEIVQLKGDFQEILANLKEFNENIKKTENNFSQNKKTNVSQDSIMKFANLEEMYASLSEASARDAVKGFVEEEIRKANEKWVTEQAAKEAEAQKATEALAKVGELEEKLAQLQGQLDARAAQERLDARMETINEKYEIDSAASAWLVKEIRDKDDESFAAWFDGVKSILTPKADKTKAKEAVASKSNEEDATDALDNAEVKDQGLANAGGGELTQREKWAKGFSMGESVKIKR